MCSVDPDGNAIADKAISVGTGTTDQFLLGPFPLNWNQVLPISPLPDGPLTDWLSSTDLNQWTEVTSGGAVERVAGWAPGATHQFACQLRRTTTGSLYVVTRADLAFHLPASTKWKLRGWLRNTTPTLEANLGIQVFDVTPATDQYLRPDGTWQDGTADALVVSPRHDPVPEVVLPFTAKADDAARYRVTLAGGPESVNQTIQLAGWSLERVDHPEGFLVDVSGSGRYLRAFRLQ